MFAEKNRPRGVNGGTHMLSNEAIQLRVEELLQQMTPEEKRAYRRERARKRRRARRAAKAAINNTEHSTEEHN